MQQRTPSISNALFISMGGIGNLVLLTPALRVFEAYHPQARLHFLLPPNGSRQVVECHARIGEIIETVPSASRLPGLIAVVRRLRADIAVSASGTNPLKSGLIGLLGGAPVRLGESFGAGKALYTTTVPFDPSLHECEANLRIVRALAPSTETPAPTVWTNDHDRTLARKFIDKHGLHSRWIGLHLGSGPAMAYKRWPAERFIAVARALIEQWSCRVVIFGGPDESVMANEAALRIGTQTVAATGKLTIRQSFEIMKHAALFISNDSGPMHLAAASGAPVIALFGPTMDHKTAPPGNRNVILTAPVACRPCYAYRPVACRTFECLDGISVEQVVDAAKRLTGDAPGKRDDNPRP